jgi:hypothetical protein
MGRTIFGAGVSAEAIRDESAASTLTRIAFAEAMGETFFALYSPKRGGNRQMTDAPLSVQCWSM